MQDINRYFKSRKYPGRIVISGVNANNEIVLAYIIQGRSHNSRNRKLIKVENSIQTLPIDDSIVTNRDLIIYKALIELDDVIYLTNGDHGLSILSSPSLYLGLANRTVEEDPPINTPRIGVIVDKKKSIIKIFFNKRK